MRRQPKADSSLRGRSISVNKHTYMSARWMIPISVLLILVEGLPSIALAKPSELTASVSNYADTENPSGEEIRAAVGAGPWHWENPRPQGNWLRTIFALAPDDVWAGGINTLMHWDGKNWRLALPDFALGHLSVRQIWASDTQHVWAVLDYPSAIIEWRDGIWVNTGLPSSFVYWDSIWGTGPYDVWAVGNPGVYHWDGTWTRRTPDAWTTGGGILWGTATDDVTVWHTETLCFHWNGSSWQTIDPPPARYVGGAGPGEPWFKNILDSYFLRFRKGVWESYLSPVDRAAPVVWSFDGTEAWALGGGGFLHFDGKAWSMAQPLTQPLNAISGSAPDHVWAVGETGSIVRFNGRFEERRAGSVADLNGIFGFSESEVWAVGNSGTVLHRRPTGWERIQLPTQRNLLAIGGTSANDLWVVGEAGSSLHFDGKSWSNVQTGTMDDMVSVWASGPSDVWAGTPLRTYHSFLHWDGTAWSDWKGARPPGTVSGFWGFAPDDVWAVGSVCDYIYPFDPLCIKTASHFDGSAWTVHYFEPAVHSTFERLVAIWGSESRDVWALAENNASYHWDGEHWSQVQFPEIYHCTGLWGRTKNDVFATCGNSIVHWNGDVWSILPTLSGEWLFGLWGVDSTFWVVGRDGIILKHSAAAEE
jgi:hypothetical protein